MIAQFPVWLAIAKRKLGVFPTLEQWKKLTKIQRFVLTKLSRSNHENRNFIPALREFHLV